MKKVYLISERKFPDGDAGGLRTKNLAQLFRSSGFDVRVISCGNYMVESNDFKEYEGVLFKNVGARRGLAGYLSRAFKVGQIIRSLDLKANDSYHIYSTNLIFVFILYFFYLPKSNISYDVVELFGSEKFKWSVINPKYYAFKVLAKYFYRIGVCNTYITKEAQKKISGRSLSGIVIPSIIDRVRDYSRKGFYKPDERNLMYLGNPQAKDDVSLMLESLEPYFERGMRFHLTGLDYEGLILLVGARFGKYFNKSIFCYGWLESREYEALKLSCDFLYSIRYEGGSNRYNFPTKMVELFSEGIPLVGYNADESGSFMKDGENSVTIKRRDLDSVRQALSRVQSMHDYEYRHLSQGALECAKENFHILKFIESVSAEYKND